MLSHKLNEEQIGSGQELKPSALILSWWCRKNEEIYGSNAIINTWPAAAPQRTLAWGESSRSV